MSQTVPLSKVPKDVNDLLAKRVYNPMKVDFTHKFDGKAITIKAGESYDCAENVAVHLAKHLARRIVKRVAAKDREEILKNVEKSQHLIVMMKPYPLFNYRVGDVAQMLVTDTRTTETPKAEEILDAASEETARNRDRGEEVQKPKEEVDTTSADLIGEETVEEVEDVVEGETVVEFDDMTVKQLRDYAKECDIDLGDSVKKDDILKIVKKFG